MLELAAINVTTSYNIRPLNILQLDDQPIDYILC